MKDDVVWMVDPQTGSSASRMVLVSTLYDRSRAMYMHEVKDADGKVSFVPEASLRFH